MKQSARERVDVMYGGGGEKPWQRLTVKVITLIASDMFVVSVKSKSSII